MAGIFPDSGVAPANTANAVDGDASCTELYYSTTLCVPRFDPSASNAVVSEILNAVNKAGIQYDCGVLTNLCTAIQAFGILPAANNLVVPVGGAVRSDTGDVYLNNTAAPVTLTGTDNATLEALGLNDIVNGAQPVNFSIAAAPGTDTLGVFYPVGSSLITVGTGTYALERPIYTQTPIALNAADYQEGHVWNDTTMNIVSRLVLDTGGNKVWQQIN